MIEVNKIYNGDCLDIMQKIENKTIDLVLTSPPYNTSRNSGSMDNYEKRYDIYLEQRNNDEYINWTLNIFNEYNRILKDNGCILYNITYGNENADLLYLLLGDLIRKTDFTIADTIVWKKYNALPNNVSHNKLTRICEFIYVFCRKNEYKTFNCNKKVVNISTKGQKIYENITNFIIAKNNDEVCKLNKATFSTDLCNQLLNIYGKEKYTVLDNFSGTGTTLLSAYKNNMNYIGIELSKAQCEYSQKRLDVAQSQLRLF